MNMLIGPRRSLASARITGVMDDTQPEVGATGKVAVEQLVLDRENPRLVDRAEHATDESIIARLYRTAELDELLQSISTNGYLDIEPLVAMADSAGGGFIVLEGNRRLATLRLLREPDLEQRLALSEHVRIAIPDVEDSLRSTLDQVTVYRVATREEARAFIGFKHINGPAKWDAYAKARFAADWYRKGRDEGVSLDQIAGTVGDRHATVKRMVFAIYVLEQARKEDLFRIEDRATPKFSFSHLYTALTRSQYMNYLGLEPGWSQHDPRPDQIPEERLAALKKVLVWIYGSESEAAQPVVKVQNPDIKRLGEVLVRAEALHVLEQTGDLSQAHASTEPVDSRFTEALIRARNALRDAAGSLRAYSGTDQSLLDIAEDAKETAGTVVQRMRKKRQDALLAE